MQSIDWAKKMSFWIIHIIIWVLLNVMLGSLPFLETLFRGGEADPFLVGLLCFCFTVASSGLYIFLADSQKGEHSGFAKVTYMALIALTFVWAFFVWTIVLKLPIILDFFGDSIKLKGAVFLYFSSVLLFFCANFKSISEMVNSHVSKYLIAGPVSNSKVSGSAMKVSLDKEGSF